MQLMLVYRFLRQISDWTMEGFYSEVYVEGQENVQKDTPLILASTHHNEIIDIASLAATIPHRRFVSFWAKSSMFANPFTRAFFLSSGAIPVKRNPNNAGSASASRGSADTSNLFRESSDALARNQVIGVFPEGTSYTQPGIVQTMSGAAWAAVDYVLRNQETGRQVKSNGNGKVNGVVQERELTIVPVGIVYTDKASYQSRICVRYGSPIIVRSYLEGASKEGGGEGDANVRNAVTQIMMNVEKQMRELTVNAPDWDTLYAAQMARDIMFQDPAAVPLRDWVDLSQRLVNEFTITKDSSAKNAGVEATKSALVEYYALLHYANTSHSSLSDALSIISHPFLSVLHLPRSLVEFILFIPPMLLYVPAYLTGSLAARLFVKRGEVESEAQFKAIFGGLGVGVGLGSAIFFGAFRGSESDSIWNMIGGYIGLFDKMRRFGSMGKAPISLVLAYSCAKLLVKWHNALVYNNYKRLRVILTLCKLCMGLFPQRPADSNDVKGYTRPPLPPPNPFIKKKKEQESSMNAENDNETPIKRNPIAPQKLIRPLLAARQEAISKLLFYVKNHETLADVLATKYSTTS